jgi:hypothetical protein
LLEGKIMKKIFLSVTLLCTSALLADVVLETSFKASFSPVTLSKENSTAYYNMGGQQFKVILTDTIEDTDGMVTLNFEIYSITNGQEFLMSKPMMKKEKDSLATLTFGKDEYSMTLQVR